jgi:hypothetical protein
MTTTDVNGGPTLTFTTFSLIVAAILLIIGFAVLYASLRSSQ